MRHLKQILLGLSAATLISGCGGEPDWVEVYEDCKLQVSEQTSEMQKGNQQAADDNPQMAAMMDSMNNMATNMAFSACEMIRTTCENDPDGAACRAYVEQRSKN